MVAHLPSGSADPPASFTGSHLQEDHDYAAETSTLSPPVLSPQVTSSEAMRILASQDTVSDTELLDVADTMLSLGAETHPPPRALVKKTTFHV